MNGRRLGDGALRAHVAGRCTRRRLVLTAVAATAALTTAAEVSAAADRGYEMVSPVETNLGDATHVRFAHASGNSLVYEINAATDDALSFGGQTKQLARRTAGGWLGSPMDALYAGGYASETGTNVLELSADGSTAIVSSAAGITAEDQDGGRADLYLIDVATRKATLVTPAPGSPSSDTVGDTALEYVGGSADLGVIAFTANVPRDPGAPAAPTDSLYVWDHGTVRYISKLGDGTPLPVDRAGYTAASRGVGNGLEELSDAPTAPYGGARFVSDDGATVFFRSGNVLYAHVEGGNTIVVSRSQRAGDPPGTVAAAATIIGATPDGESVYFWSNTPLTTGAGTGGGVYRFDVDGQALTLLSGVTSTSINVVQGAVSGDGTHVYFAARAVLAPGATNNRRNYYVWSAANGLRYITQTLNAPPSAPHELRRVSYDGRYALISSTTSLNLAPNNGQPAIYRYDAVTQTLACASCRADASPSAAAAQLSPSGINQTERASRNLAEDGTVFFMTEDPLVPEDVNGRADVYEYDGAPKLVSTGTEDEDSIVADNSEDGTTVFFRTRTPLVSWDTDGGLIDVYAARVGGGFPPPPAPPVPSCTGIECSGPVPGPPAVAVPGSSGVGASGNATPANPPVIPPRTAKSLKISAPRGADLQALARGRALRVPVTLTGGGKVTVRLTARYRGKTRTAGSATRTIKSVEKTTARLSVRLTAAARRELRRRKSMKVTLEVRLQGVTKPVRRTLNLKAVR